MVSKKSFATAFFAAMTVFALVFLASVLFVQNSGFQNTVLESRLAAERFEDARDVVSWTQEDAIVDAAFAFACNAQDFCTNYASILPSYWNNVKGELNDSIVNVSFAGVPSCSSSVNGPRLTFNVGLTGVMEVASKNTFKNTSFSFAKSGSVVTRQKVQVLVVETRTAFSYKCP